MAVTGWKSRFDIAASSRRCIVLHGNVYDVIRAGGDNVSMAHWVRQRLTTRQTRPFRRVVRYNCCEEPAVLEWDGNDLNAGRAVLRGFVGLVPGMDPGAPQVAFRMLAAAMRQAEPALVIVENAEFAFADSTRESTLLRQISRENAAGEAVTGLAVHIYSTDGKIPADFSGADPSVAVIPVARPSFDERLELLGSLDGCGLFQATHLGAPVDQQMLAFATEGMRLAEIAQLAWVCDEHDAGTDLNGIFQLYRHGRRLDFWEGKEVEKKIRMQLSQRIRGQDRAIDEIIDRVYAAKHHVAEMIEPAGRAPALVLFLVGPTGVGKTLAASTLCEAITGSTENLKRFDMSEFQREQSDQRLIGSPPGYVGYSEGGQLTNWVLNHPHSVVLIDEVEKAYERILDVFLQILEGARLTDGKGSTVDMSDTILIFTSNLGTEDAIAKAIHEQPAESVEEFFLQYVQDYFRDELLRPELYNRLKKGVVVFGYIDKEVGKKVINDKFALVEQALRDRLGIKPAPVFAEDVRALVRAAAKVEHYGLRDVNNAMYDVCGGAIGRLLDLDPKQVPNVRFRPEGKKVRL